MLNIARKTILLGTGLASMTRGKIEGAAKRRLQKRINSLRERAGSWLGTS